METEIIDKLYLELSQITHASTDRELAMAKVLRRTLEGLKNGVSRTELIYAIECIMPVNE